MLKKKNIAMMTAAITAASAVTPAFAATVNRAITTDKDMADATERQAILDEVKGYLETKYTTDTELLVNEKNAGKTTYKVEISGTIGGHTYGPAGSTTSATVSTYAQFETLMNKMLKNETVRITITDKGQRTVDGEIVDWDEYTFAAVYADASTTGTIVDFVKAEVDYALDNNIINVGTGSDEIRVRMGDIDVSTTATAGVNEIVLSESATADLNGNNTTGQTLVKLPENGAFKDFSKPIKDGNGYIVNFEDARVAILSADKKGPFTINVKCTQDLNETAEKVTIDAEGLMEEGRFTVEGNELNKKLNNLVNAKLTNEEGTPVGLVASKAITSGAIVSVREDVNTTADTMYTVTTGASTYVDSKTSKITINVAPNVGYAYENGYKMTATTGFTANDQVAGGVSFNTDRLAEVTIKGTHEQIKELEKSLAVFNGNPEVKTLAGMDRYQTAVEVSQAWTTAATAVLVSGEVLVDGLTATPYAAQMNAPILLTQSESLNADTKAELNRLGVENVHIVGGSKAVSEDVVAELRAMGIKVTRIYGADRYETSLEVAKRMTTADTVYVAQGDAMADALSISAVAGQTQRPIVLTAKDSMTDEVAEFIEDKANKAYVIGGESVISKEVVNKLDKITANGATVLGGADRYETNAKIMDEFNSTNKVNKVIVVNGDKGLVDALAAGAYAGKTGTSTCGTALVLVGEDLTEAQKRTMLEDVNKVAVKATGGRTQVGYGVAGKVIQTLKGLLK